MKEDSNTSSVNFFFTFWKKNGFFSSKNSRLPLIFCIYRFEDEYGSPFQRPPARNVKGCFEFLLEKEPFSF